MPLRTVATVELVSLVVLLANLLTVHLDGVAALVGPVHGTAYLVAIALTVARAGWRSRATGVSLVPGVGGWAAAVLLGAGPRTDHATGENTAHTRPGSSTGRTSSS